MFEFGIKDIIDILIFAVLLYYIYRLMKELAEEKGIGIILISSEMDEVKKCSNRIIALYEGRQAGEYDAAADKDTLLSAIIGVNS